ncbi:MAG: Holliday junction branch migration protein RuvA [Acholeplasma sp.]|nr:Holliday junction branch migration protein RuvA [Acholeplasma sp.]
MFSYITGTIVEINPTNLVLDSRGIGYLIIAPNPYLYQLQTEVKIHTHHYVREDQETLYGFDTKEARDLFIELISVSGIGPKSALSILASGKPDEILFAIEQQDVKFLTKFPGIGAKSAQQIILDLRGKLEKKALFVTDESSLEVKEALMALGYSQTELKKVLPKIDHTLPINQMIKQALMLLMK